jgi:hypothetical protein
VFLRIVSLNVLDVVMDIRMSFSDHVDSMVGKVLTILGFIKRVS